MLQWGESALPGGPRGGGGGGKKGWVWGQPPAAVAPPAPPSPSHPRFLRRRPGEAMKAAPADVSGLFSSH